MWPRWCSGTLIGLNAFTALNYENKVPTRKLENIKKQTSGKKAKRKEGCIRRFKQN
jgi:hypothetical protein